MEAIIYDQKGKETKKVKLPEEVFGLRWNADLVHQVVVSMQSNQRTGTAHTKTRGEISGGGRKPWRQKGTGRARHGSNRSPIWRGGGVTHGPRNDKNYDRKINKKAGKKALFTVLSRKARDGELVLLSDIKNDEGKTKVAVETLTNLSKVKGLEKISYKTGKRALVVSPEKSDVLKRMFRNVASVSYEELRNMNPLLLMTYKYVVLINPEASIAQLTEKVTK